MHIALLADVHGNLEALDAVLADVDKRAPGARIIVAGDIVGYGPDPEACLDRLLARDALMVRGNHEEMVLGMRDDSQCVAAGIFAVAWTRRRLSRTTVASLRKLPSLADISPALVVCHGSLDDAGCYVSDGPRALTVLERMRTVRPQARLLVCGHTHMPMCFSRTRGLTSHREGAALHVDPADAHLINPGAVGQARDGVPRGRYALFDPDTSMLTFHSVPYDHAATIEKLRDAGLVARVMLTPPRGVRRHVESAKAKAARILVRIPPLRAPPP